MSAGREKGKPGLPPKQEGFNQSTTRTGFFPSFASQSSGVDKFFVTARDSRFRTCSLRRETVRRTDKGSAKVRSTHFVFNVLNSNKSSLLYTEDVRESSIYVTATRRRLTVTEERVFLIFISYSFLCGLTNGH